jgi:hypothetical protein
MLDIRDLLQRVTSASAWSRPRCTRACGEACDTSDASFVLDDTPPRYMKLLQAPRLRCQAPRRYARQLTHSSFNRAPKLPIVPNTRDAAAARNENTGSAAPVFSSRTRNACSAPRYSDVNLGIVSQVSKAVTSGAPHPTQLSHIRDARPGTGHSRPVLRRNVVGFYAAPGVDHGKAHNRLTEIGEEDT